MAGRCGAQAARRLNVFFGFSFAINGRALERTRGAIAAVPDDRLLLESDLPDAAYVDREIEQLIKLVMDVKGWTRKQVAEITTANAKRFFATVMNVPRESASVQANADDVEDANADERAADVEGGCENVDVDADAKDDDDDDELMTDEIIDESKAMDRSK